MEDMGNFDNYLKNLDAKEEDKRDWPPDTTLFCLDKDRNIFVGAVNIRHYLNDELLKTGGHIDDGIRPSERRSGKEFLEMTVIRCSMPESAVLQERKRRVHMENPVYYTV